MDPVNDHLQNIKSQWRIGWCVSTALLVNGSVRKPMTSSVLMAGRIDKQTFRCWEPVVEHFDTITEMDFVTWASEIASCWLKKLGSVLITRHGGKRAHVRLGRVVKRWNWGKVPVPFVAGTYPVAVQCWAPLRRQSTTQMHHNYATIHNKRVNNIRYIGAEKKSSLLSLSLLILMSCTVYIV